MADGEQHKVVDEATRFRVLEEEWHQDKHAAYRLWRSMLEREAVSKREVEELAARFRNLVIRALDLAIHPGRGSTSNTAFGFYARSAFEMAVKVWEQPMPVVFDEPRPNPRRRAHLHH